MVLYFAGVLRGAHSLHGVGGPLPLVNARAHRLAQHPACMPYPQAGSGA